MKYFLLCVIGFLVSCSHGAVTYQEQISKWIGKSEYVLYSTWGKPDKVFAMDETSYVWVYERANLKPHKDVYQHNFLYEGWKPIKYGQSQVETQYYCNTYFTIEYYTVVDVSFNGDDCY